MSKGNPRRRRNTRRRLNLQKKREQRNVLGPAPQIENILSAVQAKRSPFVLALIDKTPTPMVQAIAEANKAI